LPQLKGPLCPRCGKPQASDILCPACVRVQTEIDGIRSPYRFEETIRKAVHQLKYQNLKAVSFCLAGLLADYLQSDPLPGEIIVPVPLHPRRLRERGYNQSGLLARGLGKIMNLPVVENCLVRVKEAQPQVKTPNIEERRKNVIDAFMCRDEKLRGRQIILIDDVCTSGATLESCGIALKSKGVISIWGLTLAREI